MKKKVEVVTNLTWVVAIVWSLVCFELFLFHFFYFTFFLCGMNTRGRGYHFWVSALSDGMRYGFYLFHWLCGIARMWQKLKIVALILDFKKNIFCSFVEDVLSRNVFESTQNLVKLWIKNYFNVKLKFFLFKFYTYVHFSAGSICCCFAV